jgi:hypothetical protein
MKINKAYIVVGMIMAFALFFEIAAHADVLDQATKISFSKSIQIPGQILPAGTYLFRLVDSNSDENFVQIFNPEGTVLYATLATVPTQRLEPTGFTTVSLAEQGSGKPVVLLKWFYPGNLTGHEFVYSKQEERELAQDTQQTIVANQQTKANSDSTGAGN